MKVGDMVTNRSRWTLGVIIDSRLANSASSREHSHMVYWSIPPNVKRNPVWIMARDLVKVV